MVLRHPLVAQVEVQVSVVLRLLLEVQVEVLRLLLEVQVEVQLLLEVQVVEVSVCLWPLTWLLLLGFLSRSGSFCTAVPTPHAAVSSS